MSLDKAIQHKKEHRKPYRDSRRWDCTCRNHGACSYCVSTRTHFDRRARVHADQREQENEFFNYWSLPDPSDVGMGLTDELMEKFGFDPNNPLDMVDLDEWL